jgi:hypothetical protein
MQAKIRENTLILLNRINRTFGAPRDFLWASFKSWPGSLIAPYQI